jgi:hypothetical protein
LTLMSISSSSSTDLSALYPVKLDKNKSKNFCQPSSTMAVGAIWYKHSKRRSQRSCSVNWYNTYNRFIFWLSHTCTLMVDAEHKAVQLYTCIYWQLLWVLKDFSCWKGSCWKCCAWRDRDTFQRTVRNWTFAVERSDVSWFWFTKRWFLLIFFVKEKEIIISRTAWAKVEKFWNVRN